MNVLVTGANGYIGSRLIPSLLSEGHRVVCLVRDPRRMPEYPYHQESLQVIKADLLEPESLKDLPKDIDLAFYLVHSMRTKGEHFDTLEQRCASNFVEALKSTSAKQIIYLGGIGNDENLSKHLNSRINVEGILRSGGIPLTVLRAAIIIGSGSASFEILRDLVEKLPFMITPRWVINKGQPIAIRDVIFYLQAAMLREDMYGEIYDIGGPDIISYRELMLLYAQVRGMRRFIVTVPLLTPRLSSYWLYFITATNFSLARSLVDSLRNEVVCGDNHISRVIEHECIDCEKALRSAMVKIESNEVLSSWKDSLVSGRIREDYLDFVHVPETGVFRDVQQEAVVTPEPVKRRIFSIGGSQGWYYMNWAWQIRGFMDKLLGGVGLRRGRRHPSELRIGDALDFWRVMVTGPAKDRLVLFAEMKLPGEAWLEFRLDRDDDGSYKLIQTATFRPRGVLGRLYWYMLTPIHLFIFRGMARGIARGV